MRPGTPGPGTRGLVLPLLGLVSGCVSSGSGGPAPSAPAPPSQSPSSPLVSQHAPLDALPCSSFEWLPWQGVTERGLIRVPVELNGRNYWYQLDTGANATIAYGEEATLRGWAEAGGAGARIDSIRLGGTRIGPARLVIREDMTPGATAGTVGLDLLLGHVVVLDFPRRRFCLVPGGDVPEGLSRRVAWISARLHNGKIFVPIRIAGEEYAGFFFDTGASAFPLTVDLDLWRRLTGRDGEAEATTRVVGSSWGQPMPFVGAPARGPVEIGTVRLERPVVYYRETDPDFFRRWPFPVAGLFGNVPFMDEVVVLNLGAPHLYGRWPAFGILRRAEELPDGP